MAVITGGKSKGVTSRLNGLGVLDVYSGIADKLIALEDFRKRYDISYDQIMYMGDDLIDASVMKRVGLPAARGMLYRPFLIYLHLFHQWMGVMDAYGRSLRKL